MSNDIRATLVDRFFTEVKLIRQSRDQFDDFVNKGIPETLVNLNALHCSHDTPTEKKTLTLQFHGVSIKPPVSLEADGDCRPVYPQECRLRGLTYAAPMYTDVYVERNGNQHSIIKDVYIGRLPVMVYSNLCRVNSEAEKVPHGECPHDQGGYFIINGGEKAIVSQKSSVTNRMICYERQGTCAVAVKSERNRRVYVTTISYKPKAALTCTFPRLQCEVPVMNILIAMGVSIEDIRASFSPAENVLLEHSYKNLPSDATEAMRRIQIREVYDVGASNEERLQKAMKSVMLPHVKMEQKAMYLTLMIKKLLGIARGTIPATDRDSVINQRVESCCELLTTLFLHLTIKMSNDVRMLCQKALAKLKRGVPDEKIRQYISSTTTITDGMQYALATGNWNTTYVNRQSRVGVSQQLQRLTSLATISQLRRVSSSIDSGQKLAKPRWVHGTGWGAYCPWETPEGQTCGLETQQSTGALISRQSDDTVIAKVIKQFLLPMNFANVSVGSPVFINGRPVGNTQKVKEVLAIVRKLRRTGQAAKDLSVSLNSENIIHISTTAGRMCRPLIVVKRGAMLYTEKHASMAWVELLSAGIIEYIDKEEEDTTLIAFDPKDIMPEHTHCEISSTMILGLSASCIPFSNHNPATRNCYQSSMGKQAQGVPYMNFQERYDTSQNILHYGQRPLVSTKIADKTGVHSTPAGQNMIVAIMSFEGYNQEDSVLMNQYSLDRGIGRADKYKTTSETLTSTKETATFGRPVRKRKLGQYDKLDMDGFVHPGEEISTKDCIIGKQVNRTMITPSVGAVQTAAMEDASVMSDIPGRVDNVLMYQQRNGDRAVKIKTRTLRIPVIGDKFSSRHGQKGTLGMIYNQEDLPFTQDGICADLYMNPHAIPSRMTIAHLIETIAGKGAAMSGNLVDASPFGDLTVDDLAAELKSYGLHPHGNEQMYCPYTGRPIKAKIFMGCVYYQRLKHMVNDKIHARGRGRRNATTGQPNEGRKRGGGQRVGEMEKDAFNAHGCSYVVNERMCVSSDAKKILVCKQCQTKLTVDGKTCKVCHTPATEITIPSAADLLFQELMAMKIDVKLVVK